MRISFPSFRALAAIAGAAALTACEAANEPANLAQAPAGIAAQLVPGSADVEEFELCKVGSSATFSYSIAAPPGTTPTNGSATLSNGECRTIALYGGLGANVTVAETGVPADYQFDSVKVTVVGVGATTYVKTTPSVTELISGTDGGGLRGALAVYYNSEAPPPPLANGRMTGGGKQIEVGGVAITRGFTVHCDITLSNNIEINWAGYRWHLDKPIDTAQCFDDPAIDQRPPAAPLDKFVGTATGRLNGVDGSKLEFTFVDAGEPGRNDMAALKIWSPNGTLVLDLPLTLLDNGNIQAHFDQPHK